VTASQKYAAIVALLKDENGNWKEDVNGGDLVQDVSLIIDAPDTVEAITQSAALAAEHPWCAWTLAFAHDSDWDTATSYGVSSLLLINILLTTADGCSRPVRVVETQHIIEGPHVDPEKKAGILVTELETEHYEPKDPKVLTFVAYEDIREICVY